MKPSDQIPVAIIVVFGPVMLFFGAALAAAALGYIPAPNAAEFMWMIRAASVVFLGAGLWLLLVRISARVAAPFGLAAMLTFVFIFNWIAFGPGERHFTTATSVGGGPVVRQAAPETEGRMVFGLFAGAMDLVVGYGLYASLRALVGRRRQ